MKNVMEIWIFLEQFFHKFELVDQHKMVENPLKQIIQLEKKETELWNFLLQPFHILIFPMPNNQHFCYSHVIELSPEQYTRIDNDKILFYDLSTSKELILTIIFYSVLFWNFI
jgi:hypothetical protein